MFSAARLPNKAHQQSAPGVSPGSHLRPNVASINHRTIKKRQYTTAHSDTLAPHKDEATEAEDAEWDPDDEEDAPSHDEEEQHADNYEEEDVPMPDVAEATAENAAADHDPPTIASVTTSD